MADAVHAIQVSLDWVVWQQLRRFCRHHGYDEAAYLAWLVRYSAGRGSAKTFPVPSVFDDRSLQHFDEA